MHTCSQSDACVMGSIRYTCIHVARVMLVSWVLSGIHAYM